MRTITARIDDETAARLDSMTASFESRSHLLRDLINGATTGVQGVWVSVTRDHSECIDSVHATEVDALRVVVERGYGRVQFLAWGQDLTDAAVGTEVP